MHDADQVSNFPTMRFVAHARDPMADYFPSRSHNSESGIGVFGPLAQECEVAVVLPNEWDEATVESYLNNLLNGYMATLGVSDASHLIFRYPIAYNPGPTSIQTMYFLKAVSKPVTSNQ